MPQADAAATSKRLQAAEEDLHRRRASAEGLAGAEAASLQAARKRLMQREAQLAQREVLTQSC